ncbi:PREDICTED: mitochondrial import receptor subunit TOM22 homolog [Chrysochloris asiatica]|uniref:Mitochondrial import receptor subunit TOM22 homolog n=1 Tax=Chrysochloris asiatica TaxID=185453 RepID=A0A9B0WP14_CHRAS|nr:PREDICTED: mitochondrial import receptor subunit TOM22 homolog [Chrysochloris asiatica]
MEWEKNQRSALTADDLRSKTQDHVPDQLCNHPPPADSSLVVPTGKTEYSHSHWCHCRPGVPVPPEELLPKGDIKNTEEDLEEDDDEELDETLWERCRGLTEVVLERVRSASGATVNLSFFVAQKMYRFSRAALWIGTTSFMILVLPVVFEMEKLQREQQQQILPESNTGLSGGMPGALPSFPGKI